MATVTVRVGARGVSAVISGNGERLLIVASRTRAADAIEQAVTERVAAIIQAAQKDGL